MEAHLTTGSFWAGDPHPALAKLRADDPVHWDEHGRVWGLTRYAHVREASLTPQVFSNAGGIRPATPPFPMMIDMDDPAHLKRRKLVNRGFTPRRVAASEDQIRHACDEIIDGVCERGECDFVADVAAWLPMIMIGDALGVAPEHRGRLLKWSDDMLGALVGPDDPDGVARATETFVEYDAWAREAIAARRAEPTDDLMSTLVHAEVDGDRLDDDEIIHESLLILVGGDETTRHVITGGMYQLVVNPEQKQALHDDRSRLPSAVEEMLRWVSPIKNMARTVTRDVEFRGKELHEGDEVLLLYPSANRDEDVFADPFRFDIGRKPNEHLAFGLGAHYCLGSSLARLELRVMFDRLLDRLPDIELVNDGEPPYRPSNFITGYESMPVRFTPSPPHP